MKNSGAFVLLIVVTVHKYIIASGLMRRQAPEKFYISYRMVYMKEKNRSGRHYVIFYIIFSVIFSLTVLLFIVLAGMAETKYSAPKPSPDMPTVQSQYPTVVIDAGHGGEDGGAIGKDGTLEKDLNLEIALKLSDMLEASGINVVMTRTEDIMLYDRNVDYKGRKKMLDLLSRLKTGENTENSIFVSIHMNSFPQEKYSGLQVYYSDNNPSSVILAEVIQSMAKTYLQNDNERRVKASSGNIYILDRITRPAVLVECGFISNTEECKLLGDDEYQQKLALVIFTSITKYIS